MTTLLKDIVGGMGPPQEEPWWVGAGPTILILAIGIIVLAIAIILAYTKPKK